MIKKIIYIFIFLLLFNFNVYAEDKISENEITNAVLNQLNNMDVSFTDFSFSDFTNSILNNEQDFDIKKIFASLAKLIFNEIYKSAKILIRLLIPVFLLSVLHSLNLNKDSGIANIAFFACYAIVAGTAVYVFNSLLSLAYTNITELDMVIKAMIPIMYSLAAVNGGVMQAVAMQPTVIVTSQLMSSLINGLLMPLTLCAFALIITDNITQGSKFKDLCNLILKIIKWILVFSMTIFVAILLTQSLITTQLDAVSLKGTKYAINTIIPIVGGALSESIELIWGSIGLIKNATGIAGIVGVILICLPVVINIFAITFIFRICGAICQPVSDERFPKMFNSIADASSMVGVLSLCMAFVFIIAVTILLFTVSPVARI